MADSSLSRRFVVRIILTGGLLVSGLLAIAGISLWTSHRQDLAAQTRALQTSALLLEQALTRSFESTDVALTSVSRRVNALAALRDFDGATRHITIDQGFSESVSGLMRFAPHIRQILVVTDRGDILFDTAHETLGSLPLSSLGFDKDSPHAVGGGLILGAPVLGRFLADPSDRPVPDGVTVIPVILPFRVDNGGILYVVAALNSGFFREAFDAVVAGDRASTADQAVLARYDGLILVTRSTHAEGNTTAQDMPLGLTSIVHLPNALARAMTAADGGSYDNGLPFAAAFKGDAGGTTEWRVSSRYPVAVLLGVRKTTLWVNWLKGQKDILIGVPLTLIAFVLLIWSLLRQVLARSLLQERIKVLSQAIEQGPTTAIITDAQGRIEYVNQAFKTIMGYTLDEVKGLTPAVIKSGMMRDEIYQDLWATITTGGVWQGDLLNQSKDGQLRWMTAAISGVRDDDGALTHFVAVETDVTEQRLLDQRLIETQRMTEGLLRLPVILYRINSNGIITDAVGEGLARLGLSASALVGRRHSSIFPSLKGLFDRALGGEMARGEGAARFGHKAVWLDHVLAPNPPSHRISPAVLVKDEELKPSVIGFALDLTARHDAEENLSAMVERLNASNRELEQFAYVASHDLQEPLRIVASYLSLLKRRYGGKLGEDADSFINFAVDGAHRMQSLILDLLQLSRIGSQGDDMGTVSTRMVINQALANLQMAISEVDGVVRVGDMPEVYGDKAQLLRLFQNLIGNALKYRHPNRRPEITIDSCLEGGMWHFVVEDNGQGIEPTFRDKIFLIFQRLHSREQAQGNGIGLAICRKIVEGHGGSIWVDGDPTLGSRFHLTLKKAETASVLGGETASR